MDTHEIDEGQEVEQVSLQDDLESAFDGQAQEETVAETVEEAPTAEEIEEALSAPSMWGKEYRELFNEWGGLENGRKYQQGMIDLYGQTQAHVTQKEQEAAQFRKQAEEWGAIFEPYQQQMNLQGTTGPAFMRQLLGYYQQLNSNPAATIQQLAQNYNLDLSTINAEQPYMSPAEQAQAQRIEQLERAYQNQMVQAQNAEMNKINQQIETFASETDASGEPLRPHFDQVKDAMTKLISGGAAEGLEDAYEMACKLNPDIEAQARAAEVAKETARKAAQAKKAKTAAKRPKGSHTGSDSVQRDLKDDIGAVFDELAA